MRDVSTLLDMTTENRRSRHLSLITRHLHLGSAMRRRSLRLPLLVFSFGLLFLILPPLQRSEEIFLRWLVRDSVSHNVPAPLTIVNIGHPEGTPSPVEFALFLQAALEFKPTVIAIEPVLSWSESGKNEEQILVDQAIRVAKLLLGTELTAKPSVNKPVAEISSFSQVTGSRGHLAKYTGPRRQPDEDLRLISTPGFVSSESFPSNIRVPLLFEYGDEIVPSFALQAALLWMRIAPSEVKINLGSSISLPNGSKIPIKTDGTALINPNVAKRARHISLDELFIAAQQQENRLVVTSHLEDMRDQIVLAHGATDSAASTDLLAATIATLQTNSFVRRVSWIFDWAFILTLAAASGVARKMSRVDLLLVAAGLSAAYCLVALGVLSQWFTWLPSVLPLGAIWLVALFCLFASPAKR